jgi:hypothetical protein
MKRLPALFVGDCEARLLLHIAASGGRIPDETMSMIDRLVWI